MAGLGRTGEWFAVDHWKVVPDLITMAKGLTSAYMPLGTVAHEDDWLPVIHRSHRCDLSLFQLGLRLLDYLLTHDQPIPSSFALQPETVR